MVKLERPPGGNLVRDGRSTQVVVYAFIAKEEEKLLNNDTIQQEDEQHDEFEREPR